MIIPFINFGGCCSEVISFYESVFDVTDKNVMYFKDAPQDPNSPMPAEMLEHVLHAAMKIGGTEVWMGDSPDGTETGDRVTLAIDFPTPEAVVEVFEKLKVGGEVYVSPAPQFYSKMYSCLKDRYGVIWHVMVNGSPVV